MSCFSWLVTSSSLQVGGSEAAVPSGGTCQALNLERPWDKLVFPAWGSGAEVQTQEQRLGCL